MAGVETGQEMAPPTKAETFRRFRQFNEELKLKLQKPLKEGDTWLVKHFFQDYSSSSTKNSVLDCLK
jgi:hypothetical protein